jgi:hypothetical protein
MVMMRCMPHKCVPWAFGWLACVTCHACINRVARVNSAAIGGGGCHRIQHPVVGWWLPSLHSAHYVTTIHG